MICCAFPFSLHAQEKAETVSSEDTAKPSLVYIIPIRDDVEPSMVYLVRRGVKEAIQNNADALILHMNTNGGRVDSTEEIIAALNKFPHRDQTYTFIDTKAISAGALIASATRNIYMAPSGVIGALTPVLMAPGTGAPQEIPESTEEKITSAIRALVRANAERNGHNPQVFEAMVDRDEELQIGNEIISPKGKILTLTSEEASRVLDGQPLLSKGTVQNLETFTRQIGSQDVRIQQVEPTGLERIARFITMLSPFLLSAAFILGYIELKTPGFGIFGILAAVCAFIFFFGHHVAGLSGHENFVLFLIGVGLVFLELLVIPGTIFVGLLGFGLVLVSAILAMVDHYPTDPLLPTMEQLQPPLTNLSWTFLISILAIFLLAKIFPKTPLYRQFVLAPATPASTPPLPLEIHPGQTGVANTPLHPSGTALFGENPVDVITQGEFVERGSTVRVLKVEGNKITVEKQFS